ncbi:LysR family transcriptional regulator [Myxococcota bacterium]|nr:LysR family transcriptional regulator [Myxococcota bacterium]
MDADSLQALLAVLDHGSVAAAAQAQGLPRTTVRRRVERLEARLGHPLFVRDPRGATPTPAALALAEQARPLLARLQALAGEVQQQADAQAGRVHLLVPVGMPPELVVLGMAHARQAFPGLRLELSPGEVGAGALPADVDLAFHFGPAPPRGPFRTRVLVRMPEHLLASPAFLEAHGAPRTLDDLRALPLLCWRPPGATGRLLPLRSGGHLQVDPILVSPDIHVVRAATAAGLGLALLPDGQLPAGVGVDGLRPVLTDLVGDECALRLVIPDAAAHAPRTRGALEIVERLLALVGVG